ncbi:hypothetical protein [Brevibacillus brevis]|uniref:hypothetical protein n=1 Tax=Brevibacillus brevis TaxID=1393 RepID=UPI001EE2DCE7|nr:hypothetical protein [Brevibacillus brevis]
MSGDWLSVVMSASEGNPAQEAESREDEQELIAAIKGLLHDTPLYMVDALTGEWVRS